MMYFDNEQRRLVAVILFQVEPPLREMEWVPNLNVVGHKLGQVFLTFNELVLNVDKEYVIKHL